jgi:hypothetical protein
MKIYMSDEEIARIRKIMPDRKNWTKQDMWDMMSLHRFLSLPPHLQEFYRKKEAEAEKKKNTDSTDTGKQ